MGRLPEHGPWQRDAGDLPRLHAVGSGALSSGWRPLQGRAPRPRPRHHQQLLELPAERGVRSLLPPAGVREHPRRGPAHGRSRTERRPTVLDDPRAPGTPRCGLHGRRHRLCGRAGSLQLAGSDHHRRQRTAEAQRRGARGQRALVDSQQPIRAAERHLDGDAAPRAALLWAAKPNLGTRGITRCYLQVGNRSHPAERVPSVCGGTACRPAQQFLGMG